jgi:hypothetical protein
VPRNPRPKKAKREEPADGLNDSQREFCLNYRANGFNATRAYMAAHPTCKLSTARTEGSRTLDNPNVLRWLERHVGEKWKRLQMSGDEALARVALDARADPRLLFDGTGKPLGPHLWPDAIANSVEAVEYREDGTFKVKLVAKGAARRTVLEVTGKVKGIGDSIDALAEAIRADQAAHAGASKEAAK